MLKRVCSLVVAVFATVAAFFTYHFSFALYNTAFPTRFYSEFGLAVALGLLGASIYLRRRKGGLPALLLLIGSTSLLGFFLHNCFIDYGTEYHWFQVAGTDGWIFQGFFEPQENPFIAVPADILRWLSLLTYVGIFWFTARLAYRHLTKRCSQPLHGVQPHFQ